MTRDEELTCIRRVLAGERNAFEALVEDNQRRVYTLALHMLGNEQDASDAAQEAFLRAYTSLHSFRGDSRFSTWICRLAANQCVDVLRARGRQGAMLSLTAELPDEDGELREIQLPDERFSPETALEKKELRAALARGLAELPEEYRQILVLRELAGLSYEELEKTLKLEKGTVKSRLSRARKKLCAFLAGDGNLFGMPPSKETKGGVERG